MNWLRGIFACLGKHTVLYLDNHCRDPGMTTMMMMRMSYGTLKVFSLAFFYCFYYFYSLKTKKKSSQEAHSETAWTVQYVWRFCCFVAMFWVVFRNLLKHGHAHKDSCKNLLTGFYALQFYHVVLVQQMKPFFWRYRLRSCHIRTLWKSV